MGDFPDTDKCDMYAAHNICDMQHETEYDVETSMERNVKRDNEHDKHQGIKYDAAPNARRKAQQDMDEWDAARLKGWRGTAWEDRIGKPPPPRRDPWYFWLAIGVLATTLLFPIVTEVCRAFL